MEQKYYERKHQRRQEELKRENIQLNQRMQQQPQRRPIQHQQGVVPSLFPNPRKLDIERQDSEKERLKKICGELESQLDTLKRVKVRKLF